MEILEGKSNWKFEEVAINVSVSSVYTKYSLLPPRCMNFGPMIFSDIK
jgi:hypothetical protein